MVSSFRFNNLCSQLMMNHHWVYIDFFVLYFLSHRVLPATPELTVTKAEFLTLFPVMWCWVIRNLYTVGLPGLDPPSTQNTDVSKPPVLLAQEREDVTFSPISGPPHIPERAESTETQKRIYGNKQRANKWSHCLICLREYKWVSCLCIFRKKATIQSESW